MPEVLIRQGRYKMETTPVCGSNGLATCVGIAIYNDEWFIAHVDCATIVEKRYDEMWEAVAIYVKNRLQYLLGSCSSSNVHVIGNLGDFSSLAIKEGVIAWVNDFTQVVVNSMDSFKIDSEGRFTNLTSERNNTDGDGDFKVPKFKEVLTDLQHNITGF